MSNDVEQDDLTAGEVVKRSVSNVAYSLPIRTISAVIKFCRTILLARLLSPEEFGVVGLALVFVQFLDTIGTFGLNMQIVRAEKLTDENISTHFWLRMSLQTIMVLITLVLVWSFKFIYPDRTALPSITFVLALIWFLQASYSTQEAILAHQVNFQRTTLLELISSVISLGISFFLAIKEWGVWSIVFGVYFTNSFVFFIGLILYRIPWKPSLKFNFSLAKGYLRFGWTVVVGKQLMYVLDQFDDFWAGSFLGNQALGFYERAFQFARYPRQVIAEPLSAIFFSTYAKFQTNRSLLSKSFFISNSFILRLNGLFSLIFFVVASEFTYLFLGSQWMPMVPTFQLMIIYCFFDPLMLSAGNLLIAVGQPGLLTQNRFFQIVCFIPLVILGSYWYGIEGIGVAADVMLLVGIVGLFRRTKKFIDYSYIKLFFPPIFSFVVSAVIAGIFIPAFVDPSAVWAALWVKSVSAFVIFVLVLLLLEMRSYQNLLQDAETILPAQYIKLMRSFLGVKQ